MLAFCAAAVLLASAVRRVPADRRERFLDAFQRRIHRPSGVVALAAVSGLLLLPMETWHFDTASSLFPAPHVLGGYAVFFAFGWLVFIRRPVIEGFKARAWTHFGAGFVFHGAYLFLFDQGYPDPTAPGKELLRHPMYAAFHDAGLTGAAATGTHVLAIACLALAVWLLVRGFLGLFLRYLERPSAGWRYVADASYWMYVVHLPLAVWLPVLLARQPFPAELKYALALAGVTAITLLTYHFLVRSTFIGASLNGRRYPRVAPWRTVPEAAR